jgi:hypothetical membrane protein
MPATGRALAWGGVAGPVVFVAAWASAGVLRRGFDPVEQPISRLAETGSSTRTLMTLGLTGLAAGLLAASQPLGRYVGRATGVSLAGTALATAGVVLTPLHGSDANAPHRGFAVAGYATLAAAPIAAGPALARAGRRRWAVASLVAGTTAAALLSATAAGSATGLLQRAGLTVGHAWVVAASAAVATGRLSLGHDTGRSAIARGRGRA